MSWLLPRDAAPQDEAVLLAQRSALTDRYRTFLQTLWLEGGVPVRLLHLCRVRIAAIHDATPAWEPVPLPALETPLDETLLALLRRGPGPADQAQFSESEWAALQIAEHIPHGQHQISDLQVADLQRALGNRAAIALLTALAFFDVNTRLGLSLGLQSELPQ